MKRKTRVLIALTALTAVALTACRAATPAVALDGKTWVLQSYGQPDQLQGVVEGTELTATFSSAAVGMGSASLGCNSCFFTYEVKGSELSIDPGSLTQMLCATPEGVMSQELAYLRALIAVESYQVQDDQLRISCSGGQVLVFKAR